MKKYKVFYNTHKYSDMSDSARSATRFVMANSEDDATDFIRLQRDHEQDSLKPVYGSRFIGLVHKAELVETK